MIHVAGSGDIDEVNPRVALDHFFNGGRDDDFSDHFEYGLGGPLVATTEASATGGWHVDIPWNGLRSQTAGTTFLDAAITSIGGSGADPYVFILSLFSNGKLVTRKAPVNVIGGGLAGGSNNDVETVKSTAHLAHGEQDVTSYAMFKGATPAGLVTVTSLDASNVSCTTSTSSGRGKKNPSVSTTTVSVDYDITFAGIGMNPNGVSGVMWIEKHIVVNGVHGRRAAWSVAGPSESGTLSLVVAGAGNFNVQVVLEYVFPIGAFVDHVYDPGDNAAPTTAGFGGDPWTEMTEVNNEDFPVVTSATLNVDCS